MSWRGVGWWPVLVACVTGCAPASAVELEPVVAVAPPAATDTTRLTVSGSARVQVPADRVRLRFAVETEAPTAGEAAATNADRMNRVLASVREVISGEDRVETSGYQLTPRYRQNRDRDAPPEIAGYRAVNSVVVTLEDVNRVGPVLDGALEGGANRVTDLSFFASNPEEARLQAVREATEMARREARVVAETLGLTLGSPEAIQTSSSGGAPVFRAMSEAALAMDTPVEPGSQTVSANVSITYRLLGGASR